MATIYYRYYYETDLIKGPVLASMGPIYYGDTAAQQIWLVVKDGGRAADLSNCTISGTCIRSDGSTITLAGGMISAYTDRCYLTLSAQCFTVPGPAQFFVRANDSGSGGSASTTLFQGIADVIVTDSGVIGSTIVPQTVTSLISAINSAVATIPSSYTALEGMIAPNFSGTKIYKMGEIVRHEDNLYMRNATAASADSSWNSSYWTSIRVGNNGVFGAGAPSALADLPDADDALPNRIYTIAWQQSSTSYVANLPYAQAYGTLIALGPSLSGQVGQTQIFIDAGGENVYTRIKWLEAGTTDTYSWRAWQRVTRIDDILQFLAPYYLSNRAYKLGEYVTHQLSSGSFWRAKASRSAQGFDPTYWDATTLADSALMAAGHLPAVSDLADANDAISNRIYGVSCQQSSTSYVAHLPYAQAYGLLICISPGPEAMEHKSQIFIDNSARMFFRHYHSTAWSSWQQVGSQPTVSGTTLVL